MKKFFMLILMVSMGIFFSINSYSNSNSKRYTPITLTIGDKVLEGYLNDSVPAKSLISQLPLTVHLNDSDNDFCGGNLNIEYSSEDVQRGYKDGDLMLWTPANNFVIFVHGEERSGNIGDFVNLGHITSSKEMLKELEGGIDVTIALKNENNLKVKITVGDTVLIADMENNSAVQEFVKKMPLTLPMLDLYGREMCYRFGRGGLPVDRETSERYEVGDVAYWPPAGSLVILYEQNGERFSRQHLGHIESGTEIFKTTGDVDVTFELLK